MPEQPDDPIHYEMKIPPEPKDDKAKNNEDGPAKGGDEKGNNLEPDAEHGKRPPHK